MTRYALFDTRLNQYLKYMNGPAVRTWEDAFPFTKLSTARDAAMSMNYSRDDDLVIVREFDARGEMVKEFSGYLVKGDPPVGGHYK